MGVMGASRETEVEAFLFDLDGVLVDTANCHIEAYRKALHEHDLPLTEACISLIRRGAARTEVVRAVFGTHTHPLARRVFDAKAEAFEALLAADRVPVLPGAADTLRAVKDEGARVAVVSNSRLTRLVLQTTGLSRHVDVVIDGTMVDAPKPAPDAYLAALRELALPAARCMAFEDSEVGARAAHAAGLRVIGVGAQAEALRGVESWPELDPLRARQLARARRER
jgi:beta-phosphoglucomutase